MSLSTGLAAGVAEYGSVYTMRQASPRFWCIGQTCPVAEWLLSGSVWLPPEWQCWLLAFLGNRCRRTEVAELRKNGPYIWVTWLTWLLVGENSCEWAVWFRAQHESWSWARVAQGFDLVDWQMAHTAAVRENRRRWEERGHTVFTESQDGFSLRGQSAMLGGKPDLIARGGNAGTIIDVKTGRPSPSHVVQVLAYMYAVPRAMGQHRGVVFDGRVAYGDHEVRDTCRGGGRGLHQEPVGVGAAAGRIGGGAAGTQRRGVPLLRYIPG